MVSSVFSTFRMNDDIEPKEDEVLHHKILKQLRSTQGSVPNVTSSQSPVRQPLIKQHTTIGLEPAGVEGNESLQMRCECSVCLGVYEETGKNAPRSLTCGHTFCTGWCIHNNLNIRML